MKLVDVARKLNESGGRPGLLEHDWLRPLGWGRRDWTVREGKKVSLVVESEIPETDAEFESIRQRILAFWKNDF